MSKVSDELLPCPFCGGPASMVHGATDDYQIVCRNRGCFGPVTSLYGFSSDAISAWNRRAALEAVSSIHEAEPEPVAWRYRATYLGDGSPVLGWQFSEEASLLGLYEPLYAHPAPISKGVTCHE